MAVQESKKGGAREPEEKRICRDDGARPSGVNVWKGGGLFKSLTYIIIAIRVGIHTKYQCKLS
jgi:hypothetical protein